MLYEQEKQVAIAAVTVAGSLCEQVRREHNCGAITKPDRTPVTIADFGAQAVICHLLGQAFPDDPVVGEEDSRLLQLPEMSEQNAQVVDYVKTKIPNATPESVMKWIDQGNGKVGDRYWTLDPIDGTKGYIRGDQYAIALALIEQGEVKLGVMGCPALPIDAEISAQKGVIFVGVSGQGATIIPLSGGGEQVIYVSDRPESQRLVAGVESSHGNIPLETAVVEQVGLTLPPVRLDSMAKYGILAQGQAALYIRLPSPPSSPKRQNIWDHAAGAIVVEEAGGKITDMYGQPLDFSCGSKLLNNQGIIATNGTIHEQVLAAVAQLLKGTEE